MDKNFSPADNRNIPLLKYDYVYGLKRDRPDLNVTLNGGLNTLLGALLPLDECPDLDGVMVGRGIAANPWDWCYLDDLLGKPSPLLPANRGELIAAYAAYAGVVEREEGARHRRRLCRPLVNLFNGERGSKFWRRAVDGIMGSAGSKRRGYDVEDEGVEARILEALATAVGEEAKVRGRMGAFEKVLEREGWGGEGGEEDPLAVWGKERKERERIGKEEDAADEENVVSI